SHQSLRQRRVWPQAGCVPPLRAPAFARPAWLEVRQPSGFPAPYSVPFTNITGMMLYCFALLKALRVGMMNGRCDRGRDAGMPFKPDHVVLRKARNSRPAKTGVVRPPASL